MVYNKINLTQKVIEINFFRVLKQNTIDELLSLNGSIFLKLIDATDLVQYFYLHSTNINKQNPTNKPKGASTYVFSSNIYGIKI